MKLIDIKLNNFTASIILIAKNINCSVINIFSIGHYHNFKSMAQYLA